MVAAATGELGRIDILVNGAAVPSGLVRGSITEADPELLLADLNTKVVGNTRCAQAVVAHMKEREPGSRPTRRQVRVSSIRASARVQSPARRL